MKFKRSTVERIVREELHSVIKEMYEAKDEDEDKKQDVKSAESDNDAVEPPAAGPDVAPSVGDDSGTITPGDSDIPDEDVPAGDDPSDTELSQDVEDPKDGEPEKSDISKDIEGRSIQSITLEPESKLMPGAKEIVIQFEDSPQPLRVLIGRSGAVKYHFKGSVHNSL